MEKLINVNTDRTRPLAGDVKLTDEEKDIVCYVGGFVLFRCKKFFSNNEQCLSVDIHL